ncbi:outer membrane efflux protein [Janthinobacterium sp. HH104]|uniref:TolC family protein n=1 Tax=Janthinobacterium sp. HH104 TaxID=1537276 RepID=UPI0008932258|nr:TolC family protein [Janthinobacterium sp. HH104]OEZ79696.1 outer membrane efflux protein [Janthinobacterium sp. HH104]
MRTFLLCMAFACANAAAQTAQSAPPATFQAQSTRGLPALLARAVPRDPQVVAAQAALATAEARYKQARSRLFPTAALQATRGRSNDLDGTLDVERRTHQVEASVRWNVYNGGADRAELDAAEREMAGAAFDVERARADSAEKLAEAYFDMQRLERSLLQSQERLRDVTLLVRQVTRQAELGKASEVDRELAQSSQLDAELVHDGLLTDQQAARIKLEALAFEPVAQFADFAFAPLPAQALENADTQHAQLRAARERAAAAQLRVRSVAATLAPKVDLNVSHLLNNKTTPPPSTIQQRGWSVGVSWEFPLGGSLAQRDESISRAQAAEADVARAEQGTRADLASMLPRIANAQRTLALLDEQEKKMAFVVRGGTIQYEAGRRNLQQVIQTRDSYFTIQQRRSDQLHRLTVAQMRQYALAGRLLAVFGLAQEAK